ncbi:MAG: hypothetical protein QW655_01485 [Nitrososphaerota archaeon]|nr:hypothetical protein [Candidatus Geocrenenecus dongiae]
MKITFSTSSGKMNHLEISELSNYILTGGSAGRIKKVSEFILNPKVYVGRRGHVIVEGLYDGLKISAVSTGMGPSSCMVILPEIIESVKEDFMVILRIGTSGSLQEHVHAGHLHIPTSCVRDEGSTESIVGLEYPAVSSFELLPILVLAAEELGYSLNKNLWLGPVHTKDDLYFKERPEFSPRCKLLEARLESYRKMGVISSEMEFSTYCLLRDFYEASRGKKIKILVGCILYVVSEYSPGEHITVEEDPEKIDEILVKVGLKFFSILKKLMDGYDVGLDKIFRRFLSIS